MSITFDAASGACDLAATGAHGFSCAGDGFAYSADRRARVELAGARARHARATRAHDGLSAARCQYSAESDERRGRLGLFFETEFVLAHVDDDDAARRPTARGASDPRPIEKARQSTPAGRWRG